MYAWILFFHSWLRWAVLLAGLAAVLYGFAGVLQKRAYGALDRRLSRTYLSCLDLQVLLGLLLYFVSPIIHNLHEGTGPWMKDPIRRFWGMEHPTMMLLAVVLAHVGAVLARKSPLHARAWGLGSALVSLLLIVSSVPWPGMAAGRPLFHALP